MSLSFAGRGVMTAGRVFPSRQWTAAASITARKDERESARFIAGPLTAKRYRAGEFVLRVRRRRFCAPRGKRHSRRAGIVLLLLFHRFPSHRRHTLDASLDASLAYGVRASLSLSPLTRRSRSSRAERQSGRDFSRLFAGRARFLFVRPVLGDRLAPRLSSVCLFRRRSS